MQLLASKVELSTRIVELATIKVGVMIPTTALLMRIVELATKKVEVMMPTNHLLTKIVQLFTLKYLITCLLVAGITRLSC